MQALMGKPIQRDEKNKMKLLTVVGARPQFIKAAMVSKALADSNLLNLAEQVEEVLVHTGQHFDDAMSEIFFEEMGLPRPKYNLGVNSMTHGAMTGRMIELLEDLMRKEFPDAVLVYGDTNSTLAGALAASKLHVPVAHVEAGLRSFNRAMPEEINRVLTDHVSTLLLCPTTTALRNLEREGFSNIVWNAEHDNTERPTADNPLAVQVGDVMHDAALHFGKLDGVVERPLKRLGLSPKQYFLATVHRAENTDDPSRLAPIIEGLERLSANMPVVMPMHPRTKERLKAAGLLQNAMKKLFVTEPVGYLDMVGLEKGAKTILTDSGGVQKEAYFHNVPCVTLRSETEWVELVEIGANVLADANPDDIVEAALNMSENGIPAFRAELYGAGEASYAVARIVMSQLAPQQFEEEVNDENMGLAAGI